MKLNQCIRFLSFLALTLFTSLAIAAGNNTNPRPFWGHFEGEATFPTSTDCLGVTGAPYQTVTTTEGNMTHLGLTELGTTHCATADGGFALGGIATFTAANGDEVWATYTATTVGPPPIIVQQGTFTIYGGTGRFENATGLLQGTVYVTFEGFDDPSWPIEFVFAGMIAY